MNSILGKGAAAQQITKRSSPKQNQFKDCGASLTHLGLTDDSLMAK